MTHIHTHEPGICFQASRCSGSWFYCVFLWKFPQAQESLKWPLTVQRTPPVSVTSACLTNAIIAHTHRFTNMHRLSAFSCYSLQRAVFSSTLECRFNNPRLVNTALFLWLSVIAVYMQMKRIWHATCWPSVSVLMFRINNLTHWCFISCRICRLGG